MQTAKVQASLLIGTVSPKSMLFAHVSGRSRGNFSQRTRHEVLLRDLVVVGRGKGVMYLTSLGRPADIGLQLGKACCPCSRYEQRGNVFVSSVPSLSFIFLSPLSLSFISSTIFYLSSFFWEMTQNNPQGLTCR